MIKPTWAASLLAGTVLAVSGSASAALEKQDNNKAFPSGGGQVLQAQYEAWKKGHEAGGGDHNILMQLGWSKGLSARHTEAGGLAQVDLVDGHVRVEIANLAEDDQVRDVWLVDNQPGGTVMPDKDDRMIKVGQLFKDPDSRHFVLEADIDSQELENFQLDLITVSLADKSPVDAGVLYGAATLFQRKFTAERLASTQGLEPRFGNHGGPALPAIDFADSLVAEGFDLFVNETFGGNGRTCDTCHRVDHNFTIDPLYVAELDDSDPLFAANLGPALADLENDDMIRKLAVIKANVDGFDKPAVFRGVPHIKALATSVSISNYLGAPLQFGPMRRASIRDGRPLLQATGWSGDGAPGGGTLREFAIGAIVQHMTQSLNRVPGVDFQLPTDEQLDALEAFQLSIGRQEELDTNALVYKDARVRKGHELFNHDPGGCLPANAVPCAIPVPTVEDGGGCHNCHTKAGANTDLTPLPTTQRLINLNFDIGTIDAAQTPASVIAADLGIDNPPDGGLGRQTYESWCQFMVSYPPFTMNAPCNEPPNGPLPGQPGYEQLCFVPQPPGFPCTSTPGVCRACPEFGANKFERELASDGSEGYGDGTFNVPPLIEAADTPPYFHDNSALTLEAAIAFYNTDAFNDAPGRRAPNFAADMPPISLDPGEIEALAAYLRALNALENIDSAQQALGLAQDPYNWFTHSIGLVKFAKGEMGDAINVLKASMLHPEAIARIRQARKRLAVADVVGASQLLTEARAMIAE